MNRTQRAIRRQWRESMAENRTMKNENIYKRNTGWDTYLWKSKTNANAEVKSFAEAEKHCRRELIKYKQSVVREKSLKEEVRV